MKIMEKMNLLLTYEKKNHKIQFTNICQPRIKPLSQQLKILKLN